MAYSCLFVFFGRERRKGQMRKLRRGQYEASLKSDVNLSSTWTQARVRLRRREMRRRRGYADAQRQKEMSVLGIKCACTLVIII